MSHRIDNIEPFARPIDGDSGNPLHFPIAADDPDRIPLWTEDEDPIQFGIADIDPLLPVNRNPDRILKSLIGRRKLVVLPVFMALLVEKMNNLQPRIGNINSSLLIDRDP